MKDLYLVLQVSRSATPGEIRSAYRRQALRLHPDQSGGDSEAFLELQKAYWVLSDPSQRAAYDRQTGTIPIRRVAVRRETFRRPRAEPFRHIERAGRGEFDEIAEWWWWSDFDFDFDFLIRSLNRLH